MSKKLSMIACGIACALTGVVTSADEGKLIRFESLQANQPVNQTVDGVSIAAQNDDQARVTPFDTTDRQTAQPQLEGPNGQDTRVWSEGNLLMDKKLGQVLTAHSDPSNHATINVEFPTPIVSLGIDLINIKNQGDDGSITFFKQGEQVGAVAFSDLIDPEGLFYDPTIKFADNSANRVQPLYADMLAVDEFDSIVIQLADGQAIDNLTYETAVGPMVFGFETLLQANGYSSGFGEAGSQSSSPSANSIEVFALAGGIGGGGSSGGSGGDPTTFRATGDPGDAPPTDDPTGNPSNLNYPIVPTPSAALAGLALLGYLGIRRSRQS